MSAPLFLAVDGGNSKTDVLVGCAAGDVLGAARGPGSSPHQLGVPGALDVLDGLVTRARRAAGLAPHAVIDRAEVYLAGADLPVEVAALDREIARRGWARRHRVENDTFAVLRAGTADPTAVGVVCGAGINCVGQTADGRTARFLALGRLSGDWGGGRHLAWLALWHAARGEDGRGPPTALSDAVPAFLGRVRVSEVSVGLHLGDLPAARVHELTELLFAVAAGGDAVARRVIDRQAREIVAMVRAVADRLGLRDQAFPVVLGGGLLAARHQLLQDPVTDGLGVVAPRATVTVVHTRPVIGAALLALDAMGADPGPFLAAVDRLPAC